MLYFVSKDAYPTSEADLKEELSLLDKNGLEWRMLGTPNGFYVRYIGREYFAEESFAFFLESGEKVMVKNTQCLFVKNKSTATFSSYRRVIEQHYTDDIWEFFEEVLGARLAVNPELMESEIYAYENEK